MKTKNFFFFQDGDLYIGIILPKQVINQKMSEFLDIDDVINKRVPPGRIQDLVEGQIAIINMLTQDCDDYKIGFLLAEDYAEILKKKVEPALRAGLYLYSEGDGDKEKCIKRTHFLCSFVLGYIEARAIFNRQIGGLNLKEEIVSLFDEFGVYDIPINLSGGFFRRKFEAKAYMERE